MTKISVAFTQVLEASYTRYINDYTQYLRLRGFGDHINDWFFVKRGFFECWLQPGFHRFWRLWNPGIGYFAHKIYCTFGGKYKPNTATLAVFLVSGLIHNLVASVILWRWEFPLPFTFALLGFLTIFFKWLDKYIEMTKWPPIFHLALNVCLVVLSFDFGFRMRDLTQSFLLSKVY